MLLTVFLVLLGPAAAVLDLTRVGSSSPDKELRVLAILPVQKDGYYFPFGYEMSGGAVIHALEVAKRDLLPDYSFKIDYVDTMCRPKVGLGRSFEFLRNQQKYHVLIGPQCSNACSLVGRLAAYLNIPVFAGVCQAVDMLDKTEFSTLTRFLGTFEMTGYALGHMFLQFNWRRAGLIAEDHHADIVWKVAREGLHYAFSDMNLTLAISTLTTHDMDLKDVLRRTAQVSRIIILAMMGPPFRKMMIWAHEMGLHNGDYMFVCIDFYKQKRVLGDFGWEQNDGYDDIVKEVFQAVIFVSYYNRYGSDVYQEFVRVVKEKAVHFGYVYNDTENLPYQTANLYEATLLYALAVNETLDAKESIHNGSSLARRVWGRSFPHRSVTGDLTLNKNGDREQAYMIRHLQDIHQEEELVAYFFSGNKTLVRLVDQITWPGGLTEPPLDTPPCGYEGEICLREQQAKLFRMVTIFGGVLGALLILVPMAVFLFYRRMRWERDVADMKWKVKYDDIVLSKGAAGASRLSQLSMLSLKTSDSKQSTTAQNFIQTGTIKGVTVAMKHLPHVKSVDLGNKVFLSNMKKLYDLSHPNLCNFVGLTIDIGQIHLLNEYCIKGSLQDLLENTDIQLDWTFKCSIMNDMIQGLIYLQDSFLHQHGNLKSSNCVVDTRFVVKLTDYGLPEWQLHKEIRAQDLLWTPPELLMTSASALPATPKADIYAVGVIIQEIVYREGPFYTGIDQYEAEEIVKKVQDMEKPPFRPLAELDMCPRPIIDLMGRCWHDDPQQRPQLTEIKSIVQKAGGMTGNFSILDNLLSRMEQYANNLESLVEERTGKYMEEKKRAEDLLHRLLPASIAEEIQNKGVVAPETYECVTIYFSDIVHFTALCSESTPLQVVDLLNDLYTMFDNTIDKFDVYKVETIGDAYMAVSGLPVKNGQRHAAEISMMALALLQGVSSFRVRHKPDRQLLLRIGIHSGSCVAGVVGLTMPRYCLFGDTVNTASRMESNGEALKIHISTQTRDMLEATGGFAMEYRGEVPMKGKGNVPTYWLLSGPPLPE